MGDGFCDESQNHASCGYDGGDVSFLSSVLLFDLYFSIGDFIEWKVAATATESVTARLDHDRTAGIIKIGVALMPATAPEGWPGIVVATAGSFMVSVVYSGVIQCRDDHQHFSLWPPLHPFLPLLALRRDTVLRVFLPR